MSKTHNKRKKAHQMEQQRDPANMATNKDGHLNEAFAEASGYVGIDPAVDPDLADDNDPGPVPEEAPEPDATTAFIVVVLPDGNITLVTDLATPITVFREATFQDIRRALDEASYSLRLQETAQATVQLVHQSAQQMAEQERVANMQRSLQARGMKMPPRGGGRG